MSRPDANAPKTDCRLFRTSEPCAPHKAARTRCDDCAVYDPIAERILIVKLGAAGDVLRTTSCLPPLKARYPRSHVTWVTGPTAVEVLAGNRAIDRILPIDGHYLEFLIAEEFDLAIGPDADLLSASIMRLAHAHEKRGCIGDGRGGVRPLGDAALAWSRMGTDDVLKQENRRTYGEWLYAMCDLPQPVAAPSLFVGAASHERVAKMLARRAPEARHRVLFNTGASTRWREKRWKAAHYRGLARLLTSESSETAVILVGGPDEVEFNRELLATEASFVDAGTDGSVEDLGALTAACDWVLTPDSLGYHVACAVGTPAVCVVGPTSPWELDRYDRNLILHSDVDCIACYRAECPFTRTCMDMLTPAAALKEIRADAGGKKRVMSRVASIGVR